MRENSHHFRNYKTSYYSLRRCRQKLRKLSSASHLGFETAFELRYELAFRSTCADQQRLIPKKLTAIISQKLSFYSQHLLLVSLVFMQNFEKLFVDFRIVFETKLKE